MVLIAQLKGVNEEYWILPFNPVFIFFESIYIFSSLKDSKFSSLHISELEMGVFLIFISLLVVNLFSKAKKEAIMETLLIISVFLSPLLFGIIYSMLIKPIFITRYINCFVGPFFLGLAILVSYVDFSKKKNIILLGFFTCFFLVLSSLAFFHKIHVKRLCSASVNAITLFVNENIDDKTVFLYRDSDSYPMAIYPHIFPDNLHIRKKDSLSSRNQVVINVFGLERIDSYQAIDTIYKHVYVLEHYPDLNSQEIMKSKQDSLELAKCFEIVRKGNINDTEVFELKRREEVQ